jgi:hypothetical protein
LRLFDYDISSNFKYLNEIVNSSSHLNARVNSIFLEINLAQIFALLSLILMPPYNVLAADCLPVQIGDHYE